MVAANSSSKKPRPARPKVAPVGSQAPSAEVPTPQGKSIFLFADGTGNSSAKLFKTNVWRMYEAIDFGLASPGDHAQVGYYDNGVGTSNFRPLALLGGIFGFGLKSNVLRLYAFLCRNYQPNDRIYVFGFSRGAFTIRLLVELVATQGIIRPDGDAPLSYQVKDAYREFRKRFLPHRLVGRILVHSGRAVRDFLIAIRRLLPGSREASTKRDYPDIEFVGVWDTVAAYGGPFAELTRGIDDWVYPLSMPEYGLSPKVRKARHALSLDDERDAFWPLLWDETIEAHLVTEGRQVVVGQRDDGRPITEVRRTSPGRLKQVWFSGVHSDVGGGYPDESLSYISLLWMMDELGKSVDFVDDFVQRARDLANPYGPIHDSRSGLAAYYRYQPRKIVAFLDPPGVGTLSLRPPEDDDKLGRHGLLQSVCVHESAIRRIISGIDNYAPAALPAQFEIVRGTKGGHAPSILTADDDDALDAAALACQARFEAQENAWDRVWWRRLLYFLTVGLTSILVLAPSIPRLNQIEQLCDDDRCFARSVVDIGLFFVPNSLRTMLDPWTGLPILVLSLGVVIVALIVFGRRTERAFRDKVRQIWRQHLSGKLAKAPPPTLLRAIREHRLYQYPLYGLKWGLLPLLAGFLIFLAIIYAAIIAATQVLYARVESRSTFCGAPTAVRSSGTVANVPFDTADSCTDLGVRLLAGTPYRLTLRPVEPLASGASPWADADLPADPRRGVTRAPGYMKLFAPLKRVTSANWMQVVTQVRAEAADSMVRRAARPVVGLPIDMRKHELTLNDDGSYETVLCPPWDGRLYLMVNDAAPLLSKRFYANNKGKALVSVEPAPDKRCT